MMIRLIFSMFMLTFLLGGMTGCFTHKWSQEAVEIFEGAQLQNPHPASAKKVRAFELFDFGVSPQLSFFVDAFEVPTPLTMANVSLMTTEELQNRLENPAAYPLDQQPILMDVRSSNKDTLMTIKQAIWLNGVGHAYKDALEDKVIEEHLRDSLQTLTQNDLTRPLIFMCANPMCALSYNAAMRASLLGYQKVFWYRGGIEAWYMAGLPIVRLKMQS